MYWQRKTATGLDLAPRETELCSGDLGAEPEFLHGHMESTTRVSVMPASSISHASQPASQPASQHQSAARNSDLSSGVAAFMSQPQLCVAASHGRLSSLQKVSLIQPMEVWTCPSSMREQMQKAYCRGLGSRAESNCPGPQPAPPGVAHFITARPQR
jgi:hypothetical protein